MRELARTAGVEPVGGARPAPRAARPAHLRRQGQARGAEGDLRASSRPRSLIVDDELEPAQQRTLEDALEARVVDRTQLILDIFAQHARQRRGQAPGRARAARVQPAAHARACGSTSSASAAASARRRRAAPASRSSRPTAASPGAASRVLKRRLPRSRRAARDAAQGARAHARRRRRARRLHERRQVDAPERAHRRGRLRRGPAVRDARPDDARVRARGPALPRHRHRRLHPPAAAPARRGLRRDARGDARRRPRPPRRRRVAPEERLVEQLQAVEAVLHEIGADDVAARARRSTRSTPLDPLATAAAREPLPGRGADLGADGRGARRARAPDRRALRRPLRARCACSSRTTRARVLAELYALGAPIEERDGHARRASSSAPACRAATCARYAPLPRRRARSGRGRLGCTVIELPIRRLRADAVLPDARLRGRRGARPRRVRARRARAGRARDGRRPGSRSRSPRATRASSSRARGSRREHGITIVNSPGLVDSGYRGELRVVLLNTDRERDLRGRAGDADRPARRAARARGRARRGRRAAASRSAACAGFGSSAA